MFKLFYYILLYFLLSNIIFSKDVKVIDLTLFNGEPMGIFRLEYLKNVVDLFVVCESTKTFSGFPKDKIYLKESNDTILNELKNNGKLLELYIDKFPDDVNVGWEREIYIRNYALLHIQNLMKNQKFVLIVTDADELPRKEYVNIFPELYDEIGSGMRLVMESNMYSFDKILRKKQLRTPLEQHPWYFPFVITDLGIKYRKSNLHNMRIEKKYMASMTHIWFAGWHCSYCMKPEDILRKIQSYSHVENNVQIIKNITWINECIDKNIYLFSPINKKFIVSSYSCESHGLPYCPTCNYLNSSYSSLKTNDKCFNDTIRSKFIQFEHRQKDSIQGIEITENKKQFYELKDIKAVGFNLAKGTNKPKPFAFNPTSASTHSNNRKKRKIS